jgi:hypothetical protein
MAKPDAVFIYIGTYPDEAAARVGYDVVKDLHAAGAVGIYDAAVVTNDDAGKVHVNKDEMATRHGRVGRRCGRRCCRHLVPARDHRHRSGRRGGGRGGRPSVAWHVPLRCQGVRGAHRMADAAGR